MTSRQPITARGSEAPFIPQEYFYPRNFKPYAARRQQAIDKAVRRVFTPAIIEWWKKGKMPAFAVSQIFTEVQREFCNIMAAQ